MAIRCCSGKFTSYNFVRFLILTADNFLGAAAVVFPSQQDEIRFQETELKKMCLQAEEQKRDQEIDAENARPAAE